MKHLITLAFRSLLARPGQNIVLLFTLACSVFFASSALSIFRSTGGAFNKMDEALQRSHFLYILDQGGENTEPLVSWWENRPEKLGMTELMPVYHTSLFPVVKGKAIATHFLLAEYTKNPIQDKLAITHQIDKSAGEPGYYEVWMPLRTGKTLGLQLGDSVRMNSAAGSADFIVSAFVIDPHFSSGMTNPVRVWVRAGSLPLFIPLKELNQVSLGVRVKPGTDIPSLMKAFRDEVRFSGWQMPYTIMKAAFITINSMIAGGLLTISLIGVLLGLMIMITTVNNTVRSDYRQIGVMKTLGWTPKKIVIFYAFQFILIAVAAIPVGLASGVVLTSGIMKTYAETVGVAGNSFEFFIPAVISSIAMLILVSIISWLALDKAGKVITVQAIRYGEPLPKIRNSKIVQRLSGFLGPVTNLGLLFLTRNKRRTITNMIVIAVIVLMAVVSLNFLAGFEQMESHPENFGFDKRDFTMNINPVRTSLRPAIVKQMTLKEKGIISLSEACWTMAAVVDDNGPDLVGYIYGGDWDALGLKLLEGHHPRAIDEIELAYNTAGRLGLNPGDTVELRIEGFLTKWTVCAIFQSMNNLGEGFRISFESMQGINPFYIPRSYAVIMNEDLIPKTELIDHLTAMFGSTVKISDSLEGSDVISSLSTGFSAAVLGIFVIFLSISILLIRNDISISAAEEKKTLGILKSTGYSSGHLRAAFTMKTLFVAVVAALISLVVSVIYSTDILNLIAPLLGLKSFILITDIFRPIIVTVVLIIFSALSAYLSSGRVKRLSPRILIVE